MKQEILLYIIAGLNGAALLAAVLGLIEIYKWGRDRDRN